MNTPPYVPYQAYKSKKSTRTSSNGTSLLRPQSFMGSPADDHASVQTSIHQRTGSLTTPEVQLRPGAHDAARAAARPASMVAVLPSHDVLESTQFNYTPYVPGSPNVNGKQKASVVPDDNLPPPSPASTVSPSPTRSSPPARSGDRIVPQSNGIASSSAPSVAGPSSMPTPMTPGGASRRTSTFRHVPLRNNTPRTLPSSPLRPTDLHAHARTPSDVSSISRQLDQPRPSVTNTHDLSESLLPTTVPHERALPPVPALEIPSSSTIHAQPSLPVSPSSSATPTPTATSTATSLAPSPQPQSRVISPIPPNQTHSPAPSTASSTHGRSAARSLAPYRPGFQPNGKYRPRTDEFMELRKAHRDVGRIEQTRLERRLEKLISLHFLPNEPKLKEKVASPQEKSRQLNKRLSSIFEMDLSDLRSKSASDLWREVLQSQATPGGKQDIRSAEQTITPWQDDATVSLCPLCSASFHPLTNRKHHCRLCGRVVCSLPVKSPQRPQPCSILFVADPKTGRIEEVGEGVDYGVRRRTTSNSQIKGRGKEEVPSPEEKFLKGVRICQDCRPVLLRQQYKQEVHSVPTFFRLYDAFIGLEKEIEEALPQFQELMLSLSKQERPTAEASAARKRLLEAFGQYDVLAKRIRQLPCPGGPGGSQDRMQAAILTRANLFLQKNMFPLQSLPKPKSANGAKSPDTPKAEEQIIDPDSEVARVLQPLLEQEALLESFVEEAIAHRKFEDAKTLKANLKEIRGEINRILVNAEAGMTRTGKGEQTRAS